MGQAFRTGGLEILDIVVGFTIGGGLVKSLSTVATNSDRVLWWRRASLCRQRPITMRRHRGLVTT
jgi:hypothetical protein